MYCFYPDFIPLFYSSCRQAAFDRFIMTTEAVKVCCWECSEHNVNFSYILNAIADIKKKKISANFKNIFDKLNCGEELNKVSEETLKVPHYIYI